MHRSMPRRDGARSACAHSLRPTLEQLEGRQLLYATSGGLWTSRDPVTYSFMPDGTSVGGVPSALFQTLNRSYSTATWQAAFQKAAATWQIVANIDLVPVSDDGSPVGSGSFQQGASNFGDIRIGATPQSSGQLGFTFLPPPFNGGSSAGDIFINSTSNWAPSGFDLLTVAIHEFGHALGMSHSAIATADMYAFYNGIKQTVTSDDVSGIRSIYGPQPSDVSPNGSPSTAMVIALDGNDQAIFDNATIDATTDQDWYSVVVPADTSGTMTVSMQTKNISSLDPRVTIYNSLGQGIAQASVTSGFSGTATVILNGVAPGQLYYIRATSAVSGAGSAGEYALLVNLGGGSMSALPLSAPPVYAQADQTGGAAYLDTSTGTVVNPTSDSSPGSSGNQQGQQGQGNSNRPYRSSRGPGQVPADDAQGNGKVGVGDLIAWGDTLTVSDLLHGHHAARRSGRHGRRGGHRGPGPGSHVTIVNLHHPRFG